MDRSNERGVAMIIALFMVLVMSVLGTSLMFVARAETVSSQNYRLMSQARYGAEAAVHSAANFLINETSYLPPSSDAAVNPTDLLTGYDISSSPVKLMSNNTVAVTLASDANASTYPISSVRNAFAAASQGTLDVEDGIVQFTATATLLSMRELTDGVFTNAKDTLQTWQIVGTGIVPGANPAQVEVSVIVERQSRPVFNYAAFAVDPGCAALSFGGGATTNSYDSNTMGGQPPTFDNHTGNVGSNGNLTEYGNPTTINGSMSTPRKGVGSCSSNNVTAQTVIGNATLGFGINQLPQRLKYPDPPTVTTLPPTTNMHFTQNGNCSTIVTECTQSGNTATITATPGQPVLLGDVTFNGNVEVVLTPGVYYVNSLTMSGSAKISIPPNLPGKVEIHIVGTGQTTPLTITGDGISNPSLIPNNLKFFYGGTGDIAIAGGTDTAALFYAPKATAAITGGSDLYGSIIVNRLTATGGAAIHYDRALENEAMTASPYMMSAFTWQVE